MRGKIWALGAVSGLAMSAAVPAQGQTAPDAQPQSAQPAPDAAATETTGDDIVVQGIRRSLRTAINAKRTADRVQEVLSAEDIGKLPEASIAESLARLPGLATNRDRGNGTQISIRGLGPDLVNTLLNGRELVSADANRNIRYDDYPAELLNGAYVYKSPTAAQVEGAIAGQVDLQTVRPLDVGKRRIVVSARASYNDLASDIRDAKPFGYIGTISYVDQFFDHTLGLVLGYSGRRQANATVRTNIFRPTNSFQDLNGDGTTDNLPFGYEALVRGGDDIRHGAVAAVQWNPDHGPFELNGDFFYSHVKFDETQRGFRAQGLPFGNTFANPTVIGNTVTGITATNTGVSFGLDVSAVNETYFFTDDLYAGGLNAKYHAGPWTVSADAGYSTTHRDAQFLTLGTAFSATSNGFTYQDLFGSSGTFLASANGVPSFSFNHSLTDPSVNRIAQFQIPTNGGGAPQINDKLLTLRGDISRDFDGGFISQISMGARFTDRTKDYTQRTQFGFIDPAARIAIPANLILGNVVFPGAFAGVPSTIAIDIPAAVNQFFGAINPTESFFDQSSSWVVKEKTLAGYIQGKIDTSLGSIPVTGNIGVRFVNTEGQSSSTKIDGQGAVATATPYTVKNVFTDWLPELNLTFKLTDKLQARVGLSKAMARAPLDSLNAGFGVFTTGGSPAAFGGNPNLKPYRAKQADLTLEWYFDKDSALTVSGFYKKLDTFIFTQVLPFTTTDAGGNTVTGTFQQPANGTGGTVKGFEVLFQKAFTFLPKPLDGFGVYINYSFTDSSIGVAEADNAIGTIALPGLSKHVGNATLYYSKNGFEVRGAYRYRSAYATELGDSDRLLYTAAEGVVDAQASYAFQSGPLKGLQILAQASNLTDEPFQTYYGDPRLQGRYEKFGRRYQLGATFSF